ncbi:MAG: RNA-binding protein [Lachnospiraceae bacterium]|nr:RNA-binding protein [Lachnospiraceae bacterium]
MGVVDQAKEDQFFIKRLKDLSGTAYRRGIITYSDFLDQREISILKKEAGILDTPFSLFGGYESAERCVAAFLGRDLYDGEVIDYPISFALIEPLGRKFSDGFGHRDIMGSVLNLGIERKSIGDILPENPCGIFCISRMEEFITENLTRIRHTEVNCKAISVSEINYTPAFDEMSFTVSSNRLDAIVAGAAHLSRSDAENRIAKETVFVNNTIVGRTYSVKENDIVTVRGIGKFVFRTWNGESKKGKLRAVIDWYK